MPGRETDGIDDKLREIFMEEWRVDGFGDQHVADAMRRAYDLGREAGAAHGWQPDQHGVKA